MDLRASRILGLPFSTFSLLKRSNNGAIINHKCTSSSGSGKFRLRPRPQEIKLAKNKNCNKNSSKDESCTRKSDDSASALSDNGTVRSDLSNKQQHNLDTEILQIAWPMLLTLVADPVAGMVDTAYIGRLGAAELAGIGAGLSIFNSVTKLFNVPLLSVTTSAVAAVHGASSSAVAAAHGASTLKSVFKVPASPTDTAVHSGVTNPTTNNDSPNYEELDRVQAEARPANNYDGDIMDDAPHILAGLAGSGGSAPVAVNHPNDTSDHTPPTGPTGTPSFFTRLHLDPQVAEAASSAVLIALGIGVLQMLMLFQTHVLLPTWGILPGSDLLRPASDFLTVRCLGAPATVLMLTLQGVFRGLKDTKTTLAVTVISNLFNIALAPLLIFCAGWGVKGAALSTILSQALACVYLMHRLSLGHHLLSPSMGTLSKVLDMFKPTGMLVVRTFFITVVYATATASISHAGAAPAAAHQVAFQIWMACSLLADSLAVASQALLTSSLASDDKLRARMIVHRTLTMSAWLGGALAVGLAMFGNAAATLFTSDQMVLLFIHGIMPLVILSQPINAAAFALDGILFGAGAFQESCKVVAIASAPALICMVLSTAYTEASTRLLVVWIGLLLLMIGRAVTILSDVYTGLGKFSWMRHNLP
ncbi:hypothetical protein CEUSTIGMA_g8385.t1 [Chlamydomonas eustigma]|uniref:Protein DETOXIFICATION n=1 Tax=Chlamydomonas eustigma TaxID=1157962 RepID=A0A250XDV0_9CHLO|nr:hypothetical protein CEUSTIGMA_g8385.t1 [Chlamydomonas eustigma]|eukprot:GAX80950.1 hypothetical protein CEUSTIGMA_g8385.t1 [Chlamydomonas eustigma]